MKTRKMWVHRPYFESDASFGAYVTDVLCTDPVPVLVTSLDGAPDFEPGDRVRSRGATTGIIATHPQQLADGTWVVVVEWPGNALAVMDADPECLTKLPRETSVLLRVTGPDHMVIQSVASYQRNWEEAGVRVERVEDDDA